MKIVSTETVVVDEAYIGGKAKRLLDLNEAGFPVKKFIVLSTETIDLVLETGFVPQNVIDEVVSFLNFGDCGVAVRSSAVGEDGELSWAGQFETCLFVHKNELAEIILSCANAKNSETVKMYADVHDIDIPPLAIVIQEMVDSEFAGVMFTTNPVKKCDEIIIEAVFGVGESLVGGSREPKRFHLESTTGAVVKIDGNAEEVFIPEDILETLVFFGRKAVALFKTHQDIEWSVEKGSKRVYINQSRNITTKSDFDFAEVKDAVIGQVDGMLSSEIKRLNELGVAIDCDVLSDQNIAEILTTHPCPMAFGLFAYLFAHGDGAIKVGRNKMGYAIGSELDAGFFSIVGGQPRCSIVHDALSYRIKGISLEDYSVLVKYYLQQISNDPKMANYPEVVLYKQNPNKEFLTELFGEEKGLMLHEAYEKFFSDFMTIEDSLDLFCRKEFIPEWTTVMENYSRRITSEDLSSMTIQFKEVADLLRSCACVMFVQAARVGFFVYARLRNLLHKLFGERGEEYLNVVTSGIPLELNPNLSFSIKLFQFSKSEISIEDVLAEFGHLGIYELEISIPRYREDTDMLSSLSHKIDGDPSYELEMSNRKSMKLIDELISQAEEFGEELKREIDIARRYLPLREVVKFEFLRGYDILRKLAIKIEEFLEWDKGIIFNLYPEEIFSLSDDPVGMYVTAKSRMSEREAQKSLYVPAVIMSSNLDSIGKPPESDSSILSGIGVTNFTMEGEVVVITNLDDKDSVLALKPGVVLVTMTTDPAWVPLLSIVGANGGLVTEVGGLLAHAAIYAREVGMAAVLNVPRATRILKNGMRVRVNSHQGYIEVLGD